MPRANLIAKFVLPAATLISFALAATDALDPALLTAGVFTSAEQGEAAYSVPVATLSRKQMETFAKGKAQFNEAWVVAPDPNGVWGLGPTFNEDRCAHCHLNNGRAKAPLDGGEIEGGMLVRLSIPGRSKEGGPLPHPNYGDQLQNHGIPGRVPEEGHAILHWELRQITLADGEMVSLRKPRIEFRGLQFGELGHDIMISARVAQPVFGVGLLEAVPEEMMLSIAREQATLGVEGKPNYVWDVEQNKVALGRFGWKANQPSLRQQTAAAFIGDIGANSYLFQSKNCPSVQLQCKDVPSAAQCGGQGGCDGNTFRPEVLPIRLGNITLYLQALAVPARRGVDDPEVKRGEELFATGKCAACHWPLLQTGDKPALAVAANQPVHAYTDLLLHDMGEELADGRPDYLASGREWRTAPLWGIGLLRAVNGHSDLLHDGRARNVSEAILWHGGQAEAARDAFSNMSAAGRQALVKFVESL